MGFLIFLLYIFATFFRPIELFAQWLEPFRPMLVLWAVAFLFAMKDVVAQRRVAASKSHYWLVAGMTLGIGLSVLFSGWAGGAIPAMSAFSATALLFVLVSFNVTSIDRLRRTCVTIVLAMLALCSLGIYAYHTGFMAEALVLQQNKGDEDVFVDIPAERPDVPAHDTSGLYMWRVRGVGILNDPNDFSQAVVMAMPMLWWFFRPGRHLRNLIMVGLPGLVMTYAVFLSNSRGALLGMASLLFFAVRNVLGTVKTLVLLGGAGALAMAANMTGGRGFSGKEESAGSRIDAWYEGLQMFKSHPVFGIGYGNFLDHHYLTAHNSFVLGFSEMGLFGYTMWIALLVLSYKSVSAVIQHGQVGTAERTASVLLRASLVGYLTCAWFLSRTYHPILFVLMAMCAGAYACASLRPDLTPDSPLRQPLKWAVDTGKMLVLSFVAVYAFVILQG